MWLRVGVTVHRIGTPPSADVEETPPVGHRLGVAASGSSSTGCTCWPLMNLRSGPFLLDILTFVASLPLSVAVKVPIGGTIGIDEEFASSWSSGIVGMVVVADVVVAADAVAPPGVLVSAPKICGTCSQNVRIGSASVLNASSNAMISDSVLE